MLFNSLEFLFFFPLVTLLYYLTPHAFRWAFLLAASCVFYMAFMPVYILILFVTILIDYGAALYIVRRPSRGRFTLLVVSIISTCSVLFIFKYFDFATTNINAISNFLGWNYSLPALKIILPIGLSFHTFQSLSYVIEVYRGKQKPEKHFGIYALYVMFYPQLVAGPIERPQNLLHQFRERRTFNPDNLTSGLKLMAWGFFKKVVIADRLALFVNHVYGEPTRFQGITLIVATVFFAFQIYCDFSGYSDIAIGSARVMGFRLMKNFDRPYSARSIGEFWRRWHISLSTWFRDYIYVPLGGSRCSTSRLYFNLLITFLISGAWHGASWNFVVWGLLNAGYLIAEMATRDLRVSLWRALKLGEEHIVVRLLETGFTFGLILVAWILFRARTLPEAWYVLRESFHLSKPLALSGSGFYKEDLIIAVVAICILELVQYPRTRSLIDALMRRLWLPLRWTAYYSLIFIILLFGIYTRNNFIYFQF